MYTAQNMKFTIKNFFSKCDQLSRKLRIWSHLLNKSLVKNFIFCAKANFFQGIGLHIIQLDINYGLLSKTDHLWNIAKGTKAPAICVIESKCNEKVLNPDKHIENYEVLLSKRNCQLRGDSCFIGSEISYAFWTLMFLSELYHYWDSLFTELWLV